MTRKLVTVKQITELKPIDGADAIECAIIGDGWPVVVKKNEFTLGESGVFFETDSFLPIEDKRFEFLFKNLITWNGAEGVRVRTIKLRKQLSQGVFMPLSAFPEVQEVLNSTFDPIEEYDFAELLKIKKWEPVLPACLAGQVEGVFPNFIPKSDQERAQNLVKTIFVDNADSEFEITVKLDGSSGTFFFKDGTLGVCSRNLQLKVNEYNQDNTFIRLFNDTGMAKALTAIGRNIAVQGEVMGQRIQGNRESLLGFAFFIFDIFDIDAKCFMPPAERAEFMKLLQANGYVGHHVPIISACSKLPADNLAELLAFAEGKSLNHPIREGLVYKRVDGKFSFKTISNTFLLKEK